MAKCGPWQDRCVAFVRGKRITFLKITIDTKTRQLYNTHMDEKKAKSIYLIARVSSEERSLFIRLATRAGLSLGEWLRRAARAQARKEKRAA